MPIRKLLLPLSGTSAGEAALETGLMVARRFGARMLVLHARPDARDAAPLAGEGLSGPMIEELMAASERDADRRDAAARRMYARCAERHGLAGGDLVSFLSLAGREEDLVAHQARLADLAVVPHPEASGDASSSDALHAALFESGRPVLVAPPASPAGGIGARICVAWNGSAESAAAVQLALPWLRRAEAIRVLHAGEYQRNGPDAADLPPYLALHDIAGVEIHRFAPRGGNVGAGLLAAATEWGADLLVTGAYSHSRLRQLFLGGVTRHVLAHAALPVLMNR